jgi:hypothetical protein
MRRPKTIIVLIAVCAAVAIFWVSSRTRLWVGASLSAYSGRLTADNIETFAKRVTQFTDGSPRTNCVKLDVTLDPGEKHLEIQRSGNNVTVRRDDATGWRLVIEGEYPAEKMIHFNRLYWAERVSEGAYVLSDGERCKVKFRENNPPLTQHEI